jgi:hypothetical protein
MLMRRSAILTVLALLVGLAVATVPVRAAVVIENIGVEKSETKLNDIAKTLGATTVKAPNKQQFLAAVAQTDIAYINTHDYGAGFPWHWVDQLAGRRGAIVVGDSAWKGKNADDLVYTDDVKKAYGTSQLRSRLVVLVGCSGASYGWLDAFSAQTVISWKTAVIGRAGDIYFAHFFATWVKGGTLEEALAAADKAAMADPEVTSTILVKNGMESLIDPKNRVVRGNLKLTYRPTPPAGSSYPAIVRMSERACSPNLQEGLRSVSWRFAEQVEPDRSRGTPWNEGYGQYNGTWSDGRSAQMRLIIRPKRDSPPEYTFYATYFVPRAPWDSYRCTPRQGERSCEYFWTSCPEQFSSQTPHKIEW